MAFVDGGGRDGRSPRASLTAGVRGRRRGARPRRSRASPTTRRSRASAPTAPTCASGWRSATSATRCADTEFKVFRGVLEGGGVVRGINAGAHELSRAELDGLIEFAQGQGAGGLVWAYVEEGGRLALAGREVPLRRRSCAAIGRGARGLAGRPAAAGRRRGRGRRPGARARCGSSWRARFGLIAAGEWRPLWVTDFPLRRVERRRGPLGGAAPSLHVADRGVARPARATTPAPRGRAPTTWC